MILRLAPLLMRRRILAAAVIASVVAAIYWSFVASDRFVSEAHVIIQRTDLVATQGVELGNLLGSVDSGKSDQLLLRDHLLSVDMLNTLDAKLGLRAHFSDRDRDFLSRMWFRDTALEWFHRHYLRRVSVEFDDYSGILIIKAQAYDPKMAHATTSMLVDEGERFMNHMSQRLAQEQVAFLEKQVSDMSKRVLQARQAVVDYQNQKGLVSPQGTAEGYVAIISKLEGQLTELQTRRAAMLVSLTLSSPEIVQLTQQIAAVEKQLVKERARLASPNSKALNLTVEEFQRLQMNAEFALEVYKTALVALERGRVEATRTLKKVSVLQTPFEPKYPLEPRRTYNTTIFALVALLIAGIVQLLAAIVRDHQD